MLVEPRGLTGNTFLPIGKETRLNNSSTTEELAAESPTSRLGKGVKLPEKLSRLRQKLGLKAKQEEPAALPMSEREDDAQTP
jgi:hypothetical protein